MFAIPSAARRFNDAPNHRPSSSKIIVATAVPRSPSRWNRRSLRRRIAGEPDDSERPPPPYPLVPRLSRLARTAESSAEQGVGVEVRDKIEYAGGSRINLRRTGLRSHGVLQDEAVSQGGQLADFRQLEIFPER